MRDIRELLTLVLYRFTNPIDWRHIAFGWGGMCEVIFWMAENSREITWEEKDKLFNYLKENSPYNSPSVSYYWWPRGTTKPRIEWLTNQINSLS